MKYVVASDHAGFDYKQQIVSYLEDRGHEVKDLGAGSDESSDYPQFAHDVAGEVSREPGIRGVLACGSGVGMSIVANRYPGVRAALCLNPSMARTSRQHNDANCLVIGQRLMEEDEAMEALEEFEETEFEAGGRHERRVDQIDNPPIRVVGHPLVQYKLTLLRDKATPKKKFRELVSELARLMYYEVSKTSPTVERSVQTPLGTAEGRDLGQSILLVPIMRAGLGMVDPILQLVPTARVGHVGMYRDEETLQPVEYYLKFPEDLEKPTVTVLDPMLATGGSATHAVTLLKEHGFTDHLRFLCLVAAPEGIEALHEEHPDVSVYTAVIDEKLDENGFILPGLGDAGDRLFGTQ